MQLRDLLVSFDAGAKSTVEKGSYFERVVRVFLENDETQKQYFSSVVPYAEWALEPRIPAVNSFVDFTAFRDAGRKLGDLHVNFENVEPYLVTFKEGDRRLIPEAESDPVKFYRVKKMKLGGRGKIKDRTTVIYNENITMQNIPLEAWDYVVNGKPALEWVMDRQTVSTHKASGITNDANDYAKETVGDPRYPLELFCRVITTSLKTMKIVNALPELEIV